MADIVTTIGGVVIVFGALSAMNIGDEKGALKSCLSKIAGGAIVIAAGLVMKHFGI